MENELYQLAEIEISYRPKIKASQRPVINSSKVAYQLLLNNWIKDKIEFLEEFKIILLNRRGRVLVIVNISQGGLAGTIADPKVIFSVALKACASGMILAHSHPSGDPKPSQEDIRLTSRLTEVGKLLDISVLDHIIVCTDSYYSFMDEGMM